MFYPFGGCETQPLITVANITLRNVQQYGNLLPPGVVRCNETHRCHGFVFDNVNADGWFNWFGLGYITEEVYGESINSHPRVKFLGGNGDEEEVEEGEFMAVFYQLAKRAFNQFANVSEDIKELVNEQIGSIDSDIQLPTLEELRSQMGGMYISYTTA